MKLKDIRKIEGKIILLSGLHIGAGETEMHIGGIDSPVVKHPHTLEPYIPGSSIKGKVRSLVEMESGLMIYTEGEVLDLKHLERFRNDMDKKNRCEAILKVFGAGAADREDIDNEIGSTRVSFADCFLSREWKKKADDKRWLLTEEKSENSINRITGTAQNPRFIERVPAGAEFDFLVTLKVFDGDDDALFDNVLLRGLKLLELDALGGSGSRGYGRIRFEFNDSSIKNRFESLNPF